MKLPSGTTARSVEEWIGSSPDAKVPDRVRIRVFERYHGNCYISGKRLMPNAWELEHVIRLKDGGENREGNLAPVDVKIHKVKTATERKEAKKVDRMKRKHWIGKPKPYRPIPGSKASGMRKKMNGTVEFRD